MVAGLDNSRKAIGGRASMGFGTARRNAVPRVPLLMSLLSGDDRLPHLLGLRAERPVHRYGVALLAASRASC